MPSIVVCVHLTLSTFVVVFWSNCEIAISMAQFGKVSEIQGDIQFSTKKNENSGDLRSVACFAWICALCINNKKNSFAFVGLLWLVFRRLCFNFSSVSAYDVWRETYSSVTWFLLSHFEWLWLVFTVRAVYFMCFCFLLVFFHWFSVIYISSFFLLVWFGRLFRYPYASHIRSLTHIYIVAA